MLEQNYNEEEYDEVEEYVEDLEFVQAPTLPELRKRILKKLEDGGSVEQNPFLDTTKKVPMWTQMILYYNDGSEEEEE